MLPDRVSNPGPLTYESGALPIALRGPAIKAEKNADKFSRKNADKFPRAQRKRRGYTIHKL